MTTPSLTALVESAELVVERDLAGGYGEHLGEVDDHVQNLVGDYTHLKTEIKDI